jgi:RNA polymerase sigma-70 factor, ECF subfamily
MPTATHATRHAKPSAKPCPNTGATASRSALHPKLLHPVAAVTLGWADLAPHRSRLVQFARRRLLDPCLAEDLVHDVFEAVITGRAQFGGKSSLSTWLLGVLKHKIVDLVRQRSGQVSLDGSTDGDDEEGSAVEPAASLACAQPGPAEVAEQRQLLLQALHRIEALPTTLRQVVQLRLLQDRRTEDVCRALNISEQNLFVRLHRARKVLLQAA